MHKAFHDELPQVLSDNIVMERATGYSLRAPDSLTEFQQQLQILDVKILLIFRGF